MLCTPKSFKRRASLTPKTTDCSFLSSSISPLDLSHIPDELIEEKLKELRRQMKEFSPIYESVPSYVSKVNTYESYGTPVDTERMLSSTVRHCKRTIYEEGSLKGEMFKQIRLSADLNPDTRKQAVSNSTKPTCLQPFHGSTTITD